MYKMHLCTVCVLIAALSGCASITKIATGEREVAKARNQSKVGDEHVYNLEQEKAALAVKLKMTQMAAKTTPSQQSSGVTPATAPVSSDTKPEGDPIIELDEPCVIFSNETGQAISVTVQTNTAHPVVWAFELDQDGVAIFRSEESKIYSPLNGVSEVLNVPTFAYRPGYLLQWRYKNSSSQATPVIFDVHPYTTWFSKIVPRPKNQVATPLVPQSGALSTTNPAPPSPPSDNAPWIMSYYANGGVKIAPRNGW